MSNQIPMNVVTLSNPAIETPWNEFDTEGGERAGGDVLPGSSTVLLDAARDVGAFLRSNPKYKNLSGGISLERIIRDGDGPGGIGDDRRPVTNLSAAPWGWICYLKANKHLGDGTGCLIGKRAVLTAAHVVHGASKVEYWFGRAGSHHRRHGTAQKVAIPADYQPGSFHHDFAVLLLDADFDSEVGHFQNVGVDGDGGHLTGRTVNIAGYPVELPGGGSDVFMYSDANVVQSVSGSKISYLVDTTAGQSGAPVIYYEAAQQILQLVAVHNGATGNSNSGNLIAGDVRSTIQRWSVS